MGCSKFVLRRRKALSRTRENLPQPIWGVAYTDCRRASRTAPLDSPLSAKRLSVTVAVNQTRPMDVQAGMQLAQLVLLAQGKDSSWELDTPMAAAVYPNDVYVLVISYRPDLVIEALRG